MKLVRLDFPHAAYLEFDVPENSYEIPFPLGGKISLVEIFFPKPPMKFLAGIGMTRMPLSFFKVDAAGPDVFKIALHREIVFKKADTIRFESDIKNYKVHLWLSEKYNN